jgi:hypothetical protein
VSRNLGRRRTVLEWIGAEPAPFDLHEALAQMLDIFLRGILPRQA